MQYIKADYVKMALLADEFSDLAFRLSEEIRNLTLTMNDLDIFWKGEANDMFHLALNEDFVIMQTLCLKIKNAATILRECVGEYIQTEIYINELIEAFR